MSCASPTWVSQTVSPSSRTAIRLCPSSAHGARRRGHCHGRCSFDMAVASWSLPLHSRAWPMPFTHVANQSRSRSARLPHRFLNAALYAPNRAAAHFLAAKIHEISGCCRKASSAINAALYAVHLISGFPRNCPFGRSASACCLWRSVPQPCSSAPGVWLLGLRSVGKGPSRRIGQSHLAAAPDS